MWFIQLGLCPWLINHISPCYLKITLTESHFLMTFVVCISHHKSHWRWKWEDFYLDVYFIDISEEILNSIFIFHIMKHHKALPLKQSRSTWKHAHHIYGIWPMAKHNVSDYFVYIYTQEINNQLPQEYQHSTKQHRWVLWNETQVKCPIVLLGALHGVINLQYYH